MSGNKSFKVKVKGGPGSGFRGHAGIPGKRGGSAPKAANMYNAKSLSLIDDMLNKTGRTGNEMSLLTRHGNPIGEVMNGFEGVDIGNNVELNTAGAGIDAIHTHPKEETLSYRDIETLAEYDGLRSISAITPTGVIYTAEKIGDRKELYDKVGELYLDLKTQLLDAVASGSMSKERYYKRLIEGQSMILQSLHDEKLIRYNVTQL